MKLPILFKKDKKGNLRYREIETDSNIIRTRSGVWKNRDNHPWKEKERGPQYYEGHGSYKSGTQVAEFEAESIWKNYKRKEAMEENQEDAMIGGYRYPVIPVELQKYNDLKQNSSLIDGMYIAQAKLDGERCIVHYKDGEVKLFSRTRKEKEHLEHLKEAMGKIYEKIPSLQPYVFDGEIIDPTGTRNTGRSSMSTKEKHPNNDKMILYLFDIITTPGDEEHTRWSLLQRLMLKVKSNNIKIVPSFGVVDIHDDVSISRILQESLAMGYEGIVLKHVNMLYPTTKDRSRYSLKVKPREDEEAIIVAAHEGTDEHKGLIIFQVNNGSSVQFVTPSWSHDKRREAMEKYYQDPTSYIGSYLTISYRCKNEYGNYVEAVGVCIRDPET